MGKKVNERGVHVLMELIKSELNGTPYKRPLKITYISREDYGDSISCTISKDNSVFFFEVEAPLELVTGSTTAYTIMLSNTTKHPKYIMGTIQTECPEDSLCAVILPNTDPIYCYGWSSLGDLTSYFSGVMELPANSDIVIHVEYLSEGSSSDPESGKITFEEIDEQTASQYNVWLIT